MLVNGSCDVMYVIYVRMCLDILGSDHVPNTEYVHLLWETFFFYP